MKVSWVFSWNLGNKTVFLENKTTRRCRGRRAGNGCHRHSNCQKDPYITGSFQLQNVYLISLIQGVWVIHNFFAYLINEMYFSSTCNFLLILNSGLVISGGEEECHREHNTYCCLPQTHGELDSASLQLFK